MGMRSVECGDCHRRENCEERSHRAGLQPTVSLQANECWHDLYSYNSGTEKHEATRSQITRSSHLHFMQGARARAGLRVFPDVPVPPCAVESVPAGAQRGLGRTGPGPEAERTRPRTDSHQALKVVKGTEAIVIRYEIKWIPHSRHSISSNRELTRHAFNTPQKQNE